MKITKENLEAKGYSYTCREFTGKHTTHLFQKRFDDEDGNKLYFIDFWMYDWSDYPDHQVRGNFTFMAEIQYYHDDEHSKFSNWELSSFTEIEEVEALAAKFFQVFGCSPYERLSEMAQGKV
jgi:hypothetical protein